jgi:SAM-dependent methyltransferase
MRPSPRPEAGDAPKEWERGALLELLEQLRAIDYEFVTSTPSSHARVVGRSERRRARALRDVLGWSLPFAPEVVPAPILELLNRAGVIEHTDDGDMRATIRVSKVRESLFIHSAYPTESVDSVFLGPDSYRFADFIKARMGRLPDSARILDYGAGAGVGGISAAWGLSDARLTLADVNPKALFLASINAEAAGVEYETVQVNRPADLQNDFDLIVTHPPFMIDRERRFYRDGGDLYGGQLSLDWVIDAMTMLRPGGKLVLHTGASIVDGRDVFFDALRRQVPPEDWNFDYHELDPDIFGEELDQPAYAEVERIAAVGLVLERLRGGPMFDFNG